MGGQQEASRALRKKLKYGNVHRQLRALIILRALTDNAGKGFKLNWADERLLARLKEMSSDVCHGSWQIHFTCALSDDSIESPRPESPQKTLARLPRLVDTVQGPSWLPDGLVDALQTNRSGRAENGRCR